MEAQALWIILGEATYRDWKDTSIFNSNPGEAGPWKFHEATRGNRTFNFFHDMMRWSWYFDVSVFE